jgi:hypothetical protein
MRNLYGVIAGTLCSARPLVIPVLSALLLIATTTPSSRAQVPTASQLSGHVDFAGLDIQAEAGWEDSVDASLAVPFSFLLTNNSVESLDGELFLVDTERKTQVSLGEVFLSPNSARRFSAVQSVRDWENCSAVFRDDRRILWTRPLTLFGTPPLHGECNYLLYVDDGGRQLQFPKGGGESNSTGDAFVPPAADGSPVVPLRVRTWQVPQHHGPLTLAQGIVVSESFKATQLNEAQWRAITNWMCLGGVIFLPASATDAIAQIEGSSPLPPQPGQPNEDGMEQRPCGAGSLRLYSGDLFDPDDTATPLALAHAASRLDRNVLLSHLDEHPVTIHDTYAADYTRWLVLMVFCGYGLMSGVGTLLMFRSSRRTLKTFVLTVVGVACLSAAVLGGVLRNSRGDLSWNSVTYGGPSGLVQLATVDVQSAGGRNTRVAVDGRNCDLQLLDAGMPTWVRHQTSSYYYYGGEQRRKTVTAMPAFTWQANLLADPADSWQVSTPISPWGQRQLIASAMTPDVPPIQITLDCRLPKNADPSNLAFYSVNMDEPSEPEFDARLTNNSPFDLIEAALLVSYANVRMTSDDGAYYYNPASRSYVQEAGAGIGEIRFGTVASGSTVSSEATHLSKMREYDSDSYRYGYPDRPLLPAPLPGQPGGSQIWLMARLSKSPILTINETQSDFTTNNGNHVFLYRVPDTVIPDTWRTFHDARFKWLTGRAAEIKASMQPPSPETP